MAYGIARNVLRARTRSALWVILASYALSGVILLTPPMLSHRNLPGTRCANYTSDRIVC